MRGRFTDQGGLFSYIAPDKRVPANHPFQEGPEIVRDVLSDLNRSLGRLYASEGRPHPSGAIAERGLQVLYGIRSERGLMEQLDYNLLYRWLNRDCRRTIRSGTRPPSPRTGSGCRTATCFTKFMTRLLNHPQVKPLLSDEHFSVDGTLIESLGFTEELSSKDGSGDDDDGANFHGQKRKKQHHQDARRPGQPALSQGSQTGGQALLYGPRHHGEPAWAGGGRQGHACQWHRRTPGFGDHAEGEAQSRRPPHHGRWGQAYDTADHVANLRAIGVTPHVTQTKPPPKPARTATAPSTERTTRHPGIWHVAIASRAIVVISDGRAGMAPCARPNVVASLAFFAADFLLNLIAC